MSKIWKLRSPTWVIPGGGGEIVELSTGGAQVVVDGSTGGSTPPFTQLNSSAVAPSSVVFADAAITNGYDRIPKFPPDDLPQTL